jgi:hypothetical protein
MSDLVRRSRWPLHLTRQGLLDVGHGCCADGSAKRWANSSTAISSILWWIHQRWPCGSRTRATRSPKASSVGCVTAPSAGCYSAIEGLLGVGDIEGARFLAAWIAFFAGARLLAGAFGPSSPRQECRCPPSSRTASEDCSRLPSTQDSSRLEPLVISLLSVAGVVARWPWTCPRFQT